MGRDGLSATEQGGKHMSEFEQVSQTTLDRMVDGELTETEQQSLLQRLEETDDGWRQLALSYVEAGTWGVGLRSLTASQNENCAATPLVKVESASGSSARTHTPGWLTVVLTASVMLVAGLLTGMELGTGSSADSVAGGPDGDAVAEAPSHPATGGEPREQTTGRNRNGFPIAPSELKPKTEFLEFVFNDEPGATQSVAIPIHTDGDPNSLLQSSEPVLSRDLRDFLHERGHEFAEERDLISVQLPDGRQAVIPVRQVYLRHVSNRFGQ